MGSKFLLFLLAILFPAFTFAQATSKVDNEVIEKLYEVGTADVLIQFTESAQFRASLSPMTKAEKGTYIYQELTSVAEKSQSEVKAYLYEKGISFSSFYIVNAISTTLTKPEIEELSRYPEVKVIMPDFLQHNEFPVDEMEEDAVTLRSEFTYGLEYIQVPEFWEITEKRGEGVVIAGQDTGYDWEHSALKSAYRGNTIDGIDHNYSWHDAIYESFDTSRLNPCGYNIIEPCDDHGHGTHTMGTMAGQDVSDEIFGIAPDAQWIGCRNMEGGIGKVSTYLECFEWFLAPTDLDQENARPDLAPDIINNSWACIPEEGCNLSNFHILEEAVDQLTEAGILVVVSAGNDGRGGCGTVMSPAAIYENSFSVGAIDEGYSVAAFSSIGPVVIDNSYRIKPNIVAPGVRTYSAYPGERYVRTSGTSMAGPHVAGLAALLLSAYPELKGNPHQVMNIIEQSALPLQPDSIECYIDELPNNVWGYGLVNAISAKNFIDSSKTQVTTHHQDFLVKVYPSPTYDMIHFESIDNHENASIQVWDAMGNLHYSGAWNGVRHGIEVHNYAPGTYFYKFITSTGYASGKFIKLNQ